jgi:hypothetical protein
MAVMQQLLPGGAEPTVAAILSTGVGRATVPILMKSGDGARGVYSEPMIHHLSSHFAPLSLRACLVRVRVRMVLYAIFYEKDIPN